MFILIVLFVWISELLDDLNQWHSKPNFLAHFKLAILNLEADSLVKKHLALFVAEVLTDGPVGTQGRVMRSGAHIP